MDNKELRDLVAQNVIGSTITEITEQDGFYIIHFVNNEYYETKDVQYMLVGAGPLLVNKETKEIFETGSGQIPSYYIESYHKTGTIYANPSNKIEVIGINDSPNKSEAILLLKKLCKISTIESKNLVEKAYNKIPSIIELESTDKAKEVTSTLKIANFIVEQLWQ